MQCSVRACVNVSVFVCEGVTQATVSLDLENGLFLVFFSSKRNLKAFPPWIQLLFVAVPQIVEAVEVEEVHQLLIIKMVISVRIKIVRADHQDGEH